MEVQMGIAAIIAYLVVAVIVFIVLAWFYGEEEPLSVNMVEPAAVSLLFALMWPVSLMIGGVVVIFSSIAKKARNKK